MNPSNRSISDKFSSLFSRVNPGTAFLVMIFGALVAFELFNYTTTDHALQDLLGTLEFGALRWSTILALAFCGIDFAGIARLFTPEQGLDEPKEVWYLFGAWLLAATMNAILTWWGVSMAITNHRVQSASVVDPRLIATVVPVFVAIMVWVIRILIIGTLSLAMDRTMHAAGTRVSTTRRFSNQPNTLQTPSVSPSPLMPRPSIARAAAASDNRPSQRSSDLNNRSVGSVEPARGFAEPTYHSLSMSAHPSNSRQTSGDGSGSGSSRKF